MEGTPMSSNRFSGIIHLAQLVQRPILVALVLSSIGYSLVAVSASNECAVYSGASAIWNGSITNSNQMLVHNGNGLVNNSNADITGQNIVTKTKGGINQTTNFAYSTRAGDTGGAQANYTAYYLYYAQYVNGVTKYNIVISTFPPNPEGDPSQNISYTATDGTVVGGNSNAVFLGSYITDGTADVVPYHRAGDEVILEFSQAFASNAAPNVITWNHNTGGATTWPFTKSANIWGTSSYPIPQSNNGGIVDVIATTAQAADVYMGFFDPGLIPVTQGTTWNPEIQWKVNSGGQVTRYSDHIRVPVTSGGAIKVSDAFQPVAAGLPNDTLTIYYRGYVEIIQHLGQY
jgi:hypothetical protein